MNPTGLPELSKPLRDLNFEQKREKFRFHLFNSKILKNRYDYLLFIVIPTTPIHFPFSLCLRAVL